LLKNCKAKFSETPGLIEKHHARFLVKLPLKTNQELYYKLKKNNFKETMKCSTTNNFGTSASNQ